MRREAERDQVESPFTTILRELWQSVSEIATVAFVDEEGECIDYCSSSPPFEAKVIAAHMQAVSGTVARAIRAMGGGETSSVVMRTARGQLLVRRVGRDYHLVVVARGHLDDPQALFPIECAVDALRREGGLEAPPWDPSQPPLRVAIRRSRAWPYAPVAVEDHGRALLVSEVLGSWSETENLLTTPRICFRVQLEDGTEVTLAYEPDSDRWQRY